ncbi:MAG: hypothetical protein ACK5MN_06725 [Lachnospiraceae bacterium]
MDKEEFRIQLEKINSLVEQKNYTDALKIVDGIDWRRVKSTRTLSTVGEIYAINKRFEESRNVLLLAYNRSSIGKSILYRLVELSLKLDDIEGALDYYSEFVEVAPSDTSKNILKYKILRARRAPIEEQIKALEDYKDREYTEKWALELAKLYYKAGMNQKCVEICDDLVLWFSDGNYVFKALNLKMRITALSPLQQKKYEEILVDQKREAANTPVSASIQPEVPAYQKPEYREDEPAIEAINVDKEKEHQGSVFDPILEATGAISQGFKEMFAASEKTEDAAQVEESENPVEAVQEETGIFTAPQEIIPEESELKLGEVLNTSISEEEPDDLYTTKIEESEEELNHMEVPALEPEQIHIGKTAKKVEPLNIPTVERMTPPFDKVQFGEEFVLPEIEKPDLGATVEIDRIALEEARRNAAADSEPAVELPREQEEEESQTTYMPSDSPIVDEVKPQSELSMEMLDELLSQPIGLDSVQLDDEGSENIEDAFGDVQPVSATDEAGIEENTKLPSEDAFDEAEKYELPAEELTIEPKAAAEEIAVSDVYSDTDDIVLPEKEEVYGVTSAIDATQILDLEAKITENQDSMNIDTEPVEESRILEQIIDNKLLENFDPTEIVPRNKVISDEEKKIFSYFYIVPGVKEQLIDTLSDTQLAAADKTSRTGNIIIMGSEGTGKTRLSEGLVGAITKQLHLEATKKAMIFAEQINTKDIAKIVGKLSGGFLIIQKAGSLTEKSIEQLNQAMEFRTDDLTVILEDEKIPMRKLIAKYPKFVDKFTSIISIPVFTNDELVFFAKTYLKEAGYRMDDLAVLALYNEISDNQKEDEPITIAVVKEMLDAAIKRAEGGARKFSRNLARKRVDDSGRIILYENDFV